MSLPPTSPEVTTLLLVEDDDGDALLIEALVEDGFGPDVRTVRSRTAAEAATSLDGIDAALVDLGLPDATGIDALVEVRRAAPHLPVVVLTGFADEATGVAAVAAGAQDYLMKGQVSPESLRRAVRYAVQRCRADDAARALFEVELRSVENRRLERGLLPSPLLGPATEVRWATRYRSGSNRLLLGGDFYDLVETADGSVHLVMGDVAGHGPDEAAQGVMLRVAWRALVRAGLRAADVAAELNDLLLHEPGADAAFATIASLELRPDGGASLVLAGHPPPLVVHRGQVVVLDAAVGPPVGAFEDVQWKATEVEVPSGAGVLAYTDGLIEGFARPDTRERLGLDRLVELVTALVGGAAGSLPADGVGDQSGCAPDGDAVGRDLDDGVLDRLVAEVVARNGGPLDDDVALLAVRRP